MFAVAGLLAPAVYYLLALPYIDTTHASQAQTYLNNLRSGGSSFLWTFDDRNDLIPASLSQFDTLEIADGKISLTSPGVNAFLSLNFRGNVASADTFSKLEIVIRSDRATRMLLFHRPAPDSPVHATHPILLAEGEQTLVLDAGKRSWEALFFEPGNKRPVDRAPSRWGGDTGTVWSLRIHPATTPDARIEILEVRLLPAGPRPDATLATLTWPCNDNATSADVVICLPPSPGFLGAAGRLDRQQQLRSNNPAAWVSAATPANAETSVRFGPWFWHAVSSVSLLLLLGVLTTGQSAWKAPAELILWLGTVVAAMADPSTLLFMATLLASALLVWRSGWRPFGSQSIASAWQSAGWFVLACSALLGLIAVLHSYGARDVTDRLFVYPLWAPAQQLVLGPIIVTRLTQMGLRPPWIMIGGGFLFGLLHFPNWELMCLTGAAGCFWAWSFWRYQQLGPAIASHIIIALLAFHLLPPSLLWSGSVGARFFL